MAPLSIGYARVSTEEQDVTAQREALAALGVSTERIYVDHGSPAPTAIAPGCARRWRHAATATRSSLPSSTGSHAHCPTLARSSTSSRAGTSSSASAAHCTTPTTPLAAFCSTCSPWSPNSKPT
jgi:resolvase-like protein